MSGSHLNALAAAVLLSAVFGPITFRQNINVTEVFSPKR
jgi:hypothetical protein